MESTDIASLRENFADRSKFEKIWLQRGFKVEMLHDTRGEPV